MSRKGKSTEIAASEAAAELMKASASDSIYGKLANFELGRKIGHGQFSTVYKATCKVDQKQMALKRVNIFTMTDAKARLDCMKEIKLLQVCALFLLLPRHLPPPPSGHSRPATALAPLPPGRQDHVPV